MVSTFSFSKSEPYIIEAFYGQDSHIVVDSYKSITFPFNLSSNEKVQNQLRVEVNKTAIPKMIAMKKTLDPNLDELEVGRILSKIYVDASIEFMNTNGFEKYRKQVESNNKSLAKAVGYGIEKLPAIVINKKYVVYGYQSISDAVRKYKESVR